MKKSYFIVYLNIIITKIFSNCPPLYNGITLHFMSKIIIQLDILISMLSSQSCNMDCDAIFITIFESPICYNNSKTIHEIHMM
jgi:hypothetical protein